MLILNDLDHFKEYNKKVNMNYKEEISQQRNSLVINNQNIDINLPTVVTSIYQNRINIKSVGMMLEELFYPKFTKNKSGF